MPGVPTFRGCDECHKQKKKCDRASPRCARCARVNRPCNNKGRVRYVFKEQPIMFAPARVAQAKNQLSPRASPSNQVMRLAHRFHIALQIDDPKFDLKCFGEWFAFIPSRMGHNKLLDKAAEAFLHAYHGLRTGQLLPSRFEKNRSSIELLRAALPDTKQTKSPYMLCSTFMILISEMWASTSAWAYVFLMKLICHLLNITVDEPWSDAFGRSLRYHLVAPACIEAILNPNITIHRRYEDILKQNLGPYMPLDKERHQPIESLDLLSLMRFPELIREPEQHRNRISIEYARMQQECPFMRHRFMEQTKRVEATRVPQPDEVRRQIQFGVAYTVVLSFTLILNSFLSAMDPTSIKLQEEAYLYSREALWISRISGQQLPVGPGFMPAALFSAWVATDDSEVVSNIESTMKGEKSYWAEPCYVKQYADIKERVRQLRDRTLKQLRENGLSGMEATDFTTCNELEYYWGLDGLDTRPTGGESEYHGITSEVSFQAQVDYHSLEACSMHPQM